MKRSAVIFALSVFAALCCAADLKVHPVFGTNMMMQRDVTIPLSGRANPGADVTIKFKGKTPALVASKLTESRQIKRANGISICLL